VSVPIEESGSTEDRGSGSHTWDIFLLSVIGLFLEMMLIRWVGTEIRIFAYLQNTVLVVCFLGLGIGLFTSRLTVDLRRTLVSLGILVLLLAAPISRQALGSISNALSVLDDLLIWGSSSTDDPVTRTALVVFGLIGTFLLMFLLLDIFVPVGRLLGRLMDDHPNTIWAYSANVAGSLVGTWLFVLLSLLFQPPVTWFIVFAILMVMMLKRYSANWRTNLVLLGCIVVLAWPASMVSGALNVIWSPYQKLVARASDPSKNEFGNFIITVNNTGYQAINDLSQARISASPAEFPPSIAGLSQYDIPLLLHPDPESYLIVGAGAGNDAAGGLRHGVKHVTAVEIDPAIIEMGRALHPENPYDSSSVELVNDDARSYFASSDKKFDVIAFSLLDSHTTTAMTNARLDHYVYTSESIKRARSLLAQGGIMVLSFEAAKPYIADRMGRLLREEFGEDPIVFRVAYGPNGWGGVMFVAGALDTARAQISRNPRLANFVAQSQHDFPIALSYTTKVTNDDWPYIYLETPRIPTLYFLLAGLMVILVLVSYRRWDMGGIVTAWDRSHWHFFFLGAAFLLLEVQNISKASVVLGNTWQVNAVIISGVLGMALVANLLALRFPDIPLSLTYIALIAVCLGLYFVDLAQFAFLPYAAKALIVGALTTLPMLFSGIVFIRSFAVVSGKDHALGANIMGALVGALVQSVTFVTGIKALLLIVAGFYFLSFITRPHAAVNARPVASPVVKISDA
jgi:spermidine synthase